MHVSKLELNSRSNEELMELYASGSFEAFDIIYSRYSKRTYSYFIKKIKNSTDAEELLQLLYMKLHSTKHLFLNEYKFEQWLFVIAKSVLIDFLRKNKKHIQIDSIDEKEFYIFNGTEVEGNQDIDSHLDHLNEKEKELLKLRYAEELSFKEMAERLSLSEVSLRKFISRTIKKLQHKHGVKP